VADQKGYSNTTEDPQAWEGLTLPALTSHQMIRAAS